MDFEALAASIKADGGATIEAATGRKVTTGFAVAGVAPAIKVPAEDLTGDTLREALAHYGYGHARWFGAWIEEDGTVWLEPTEVYPFERTARATAERRAEIAYYAIERGEAVYVNRAALAA